MKDHKIRSAHRRITHGEMYTYTLYVQGIASKGELDMLHDMACRLGSSVGLIKERINTSDHATGKHAWNKKGVSK